MFKILLWVIIAVGIFLLRDRILGGIVASCVLCFCIFLSIFLLDNFTIFKVRDYIDVAFYDEAVKDPEGTIDTIKDGITDGTSVVVDKVNEYGETLDNEYANGENSSNGETTVDDSEFSTEPVISKNGGNTTTEEPKDNPSNVEGVVTNDNPDIPLDSYAFNFPIDLERVKSAVTLTEKDLEIVKSLTNLITIEYEGDNYNFATVRGESQFYIYSKE